MKLDPSSLGQWKHTVLSGPMQIALANNSWCGSYALLGVDPPACKWSSRGHSLPKSARHTYSGCSEGAVSSTGKAAAFDSHFCG